jgi:hypothetical protein
VPSSSTFLKGQWQGVYTSPCVSTSFCCPVGEVQVEEVEDKYVRIKGSGNQRCPNNRFDYTIVLKEPSDTTYPFFGFFLQGAPNSSGNIRRNINRITLSIDNTMYVLYDKTQ